MSEKDLLETMLGFSLGLALLMWLTDEPTGEIVRVVGTVVFFTLWSIAVNHLGKNNKTKK